MTYICNDWEFTEECSEAFLRGEAVEGAVTVDIPHTVKELPLQYADEKSYQMISGYRKLINLKKEPGMRYILRFEGAAHIAEVYANGVKIAEHRNGYTAFSADITDYIRTKNADTDSAESTGNESGININMAEDGDCLVAVRLDSTENPAVPQRVARFDVRTAN